MRRGLLFVVLVTTLLPMLPTQAAAEEVSARLRHAGGKARAGETVEVQVELRWPGRPELHAPGPPRINLPEGATHSLGRTGTDFDGQSTRWWTNLRIDLPDRSGPWTLGPTKLKVLGADGPQEVEAASIELGGRSQSRHLLGQGIGSGAVVLFVVGWLGLRLRQLRRHESADRANQSKAEALLADSGQTSGDEGLQLLLEARLALDAQDVDNALPPTAEFLRERLERSRFGGEGITDAECRELQQAIKALMEV
ncbi:MAG: hypothetical protein VX498_15515 [Myxococcota bacterium]|nr:hypothetical protein [Myxococcota bacterium]